MDPEHNAQTPEAALAALNFDNRFLRALPADPDPENRVRRVSGACYSRVAPRRVANPRLVACAAEVAESLGLTESDCASELFAQVFSGNRLLPGMEPYACCYGGHQFGAWAGQLGDGRAINLGEAVNRRGERRTLQLKGAGPTPYSRSGDGLAVLRSSLREFLCSEAMFHLGVPTTRALSLVLTGEQVVRDILYDGHPKAEPGAVLCRVAPSFTRFGSFEIFARNNDPERLRRLADYTISNDFPELGAPCSAVYGAWFEEICRRTAALIVHWMRVGFVHGVMNSDNMSILGLTLDYGPYGWLEGYDPDWTPNTTDLPGRRYRFGNQPQVALWNLAQLGNALFPLLGRAKPLETGLQVYGECYRRGWREMMARKLGLEAFDAALVEELERVLQLAETDMTIFYRRLAELPLLEATNTDEEQLLAPLAAAFYREEALRGAVRRPLCDWLHAYRGRLEAEGLPPALRRERMNAVNPKYVLRNYLAQQAIDRAEAGDFALTGELLEVLRHPYAEQPQHVRFAHRRPEWARHRAGCSMLSCSS